MCRVAMWNKAGEGMLERKIGLVDFMEYLEKAFGGHGNGIGLLYPNGKVKILKGVKFTCQEIASILQKEDYKWCIYHTRIASVGTVNDSNCHPFKYGQTVLAMNGTETGFSRIGELMNITDTEAVLRVSKKFGNSVYKMAEKLSSVYMGFEYGVPFVTAGGSYTDLELINEGDAVCFASEFPVGINAYEPAKKPFSWHEGKTIEVVEVDNSKKYKKYNSYYKGYDAWDDYYYDYSNTTSTKSSKKDNDKIDNVKSISEKSSYLIEDRDEINDIDWITRDGVL